jgi:hypothetical protein
MKNNAKQPVFFVSKTSRRDIFRIETRIWENNGVLSVEKRTVTKEAEAHLNRMLATYKSLSGLKNLSEELNLVKPIKTSPGALKFEYLEGQSAERTLLESILAEDRAAAVAIIDRLMALIDALPALKINPTGNPEYKEVFGNTFNRSAECTGLGIIDLNLDNFIVDKNGVWHLFDYEWMFDFPVPKELLRLRFMWYFVSRHREILRYHAQRIEMLEIGEGTLVPEFLYDKYGDLFRKIDTLLPAELSFQKYVSGEDLKAPVIYGKGPRTVKVEPESLGIEAAIRRLASAQIEKIREELQTEQEQRALIEARLNRITSTKSFRLAKKVVAAKRKLVPKRRKSD